MKNNEIKCVLLKTGFVVDNEYLDKYVELMVLNATTHQQNGVTQRHHIIPKCVFVYSGTKVDSSNDNIVHLRYVDHIRAHYFLCMCANDNRFLSANTLAIRYVLKGKSLREFLIDDIDETILESKYKEAKEYVYAVTHTQSACEKIQKTLHGCPSHWNNKKESKDVKKKEHTELGLKRLGVGNPFYGKSHSQETKDKIARANGHPVNMLQVGTGKVLKSFVSIKSAVDYLISIGATENKSAFVRIKYVCEMHNVNRHAYGYSWEYCK